MESVTAAENRKPHYDQIDALKGLAIFLVVLAHSIILYPIDLHENAVCGFLFRWLSSVHMPLFFLISGFCFSYKTDYRTYILKKIRRIAIPYVVFCAIDILPRALLPSLVNRSRGIGESVVKMLVNGGEYWFLYSLFLIFLIYPLLDKLIVKRLIATSAVMLLLLILHFTLPEVNVLRLNRTIQYLFYFILGKTIRDFTGNALLDPPADRNKLIPVLLPFLFAAGFALSIPDSTYLNVPVSLIGIVSFYLCSRYSWFTALFKRFGKYSLQIYLLNGFLLVISRTVIVKLCGVTNPVLIISFNMFVDFLLSYLFVKYVCERIKPVRFVMGMN